MLQAFLDECEQAFRGIHDKEFEPTEASEISRPSVNKTDNFKFLFQSFLDKCEQACRGVHDKKFEPTEASDISRPCVSETDNLIILSKLLWSLK